jgi:N-methylhydantoinase A
MRVSISSEVAPEIREFERTSTTIANVYVQSRVEEYLSELQARLARSGFLGTLLMMLSSGGIATIETAVRFPIRLLESGPAAGALAAASFGAACGYSDLLSFDMGGTTAKFCVIDRGQPLITYEFEVDRRYRFKKGSGLPLKASVIEMIEIGAGGGSIAHIDSLGLLKVGPESAGAEPGPVCYGRGGTEPTVTDADLVLGYLDPDYFLGGRLKLDLAGARQAIKEKIADRSGISVEEAAWGIHQIVNENMANAARIHTLERGKDLRRFPVFAFGGAGPVHGFRIARALGSPTLIVPFGAGVTSAVGFLTAPLAFDFVRSWPGALELLDWTKANDLFAEMEAEGQALLEASGVPSAQISHRREADLRYVGQGHEIRVPLPPGVLDSSSAATITASFEEVYRRLYERLSQSVPIEIINWRVISSGPRPQVRLQADRAGLAITQSALKGYRKAYFPQLLQYPQTDRKKEGANTIPQRTAQPDSVYSGTPNLSNDFASGGYHDTPVYDRYRLVPGKHFTGPAIIEERESTTIVGPDGHCHVDEQWNLLIEHQSSYEDAQP